MYAPDLTSCSESLRDLLCLDSVSGTDMKWKRYKHDTYVCMYVYPSETPPAKKIKRKIPGSIFSTRKIRNIFIERKKIKRNDQLKLLNVV